MMATYFNMTDWMTRRNDKTWALEWLTQSSGTNACVKNVTFTTASSTTSVLVPAHPNNLVSTAPPVRQPAPLAFSPTINATELVLEFLAEARRLIPGLSREQFLRLTIADFFAFLIRRAAQTDGVAPPELAESEIRLPLRPNRCGACGRFLPRRYELLRLYHCGAPCLTRAAARNDIALTTIRAAKDAAKPAGGER